MKHKVFIFLLAILPLVCLSQQPNKIEIQRSFVSFTDYVPANFSADQHYYLAVWADAKPASKLLIRTLDDHTGIISITSKKEFQELSSQYLIASVNNFWKYSPPLLQQINNIKKTASDKYLLSGNNLEELGES